MAHLDYPAPGLLGGITLLDFDLFAPVNDVGNVPMLVDDLQILGTAVASVSAQMLAPTKGRTLALDCDGREHGIESLAVIHVGCGHDERQRDATTVDQQMPLAPLFFPDPSGWVRRLPVPTAPSSVHRRRFAIARRYPACRRTRPDQPSTTTRRSLLSPIRESACGPRWRCRSVRRATPSTGSPCAARIR